MRNMNSVIAILSMILLPGLTAADWSVRIDGVYGQSIDFSTGDGPGATMKVELYDACRVDAAYREDLGELFPSNHVDGLYMDASAIYNNPGCCNKISFTFEPHINETRLWNDNFDGTGTVAFCAQVALYDGGTLVNLAEARVEYRHNTENQEVWLETYSITDAAGFMDAEDSGVWFDGSLQSYFCDPNSHTLMDYGVIGQGTIMSICFQVPDGQFEIKDVMELSVHGADGYGPSQPIISGSSILEHAIALKSCYDHGDGDTNICIVQFLLKAEFFESSAITLTGTGTVLLELGDSNNRRLVQAEIALPTPDLADAPRRKMEGNFITSPYQVKASRFFITPGSRPTTGRNAGVPSLANDADSTTNNILFAFLVMTSVLFCCVSTCYIAHRCTLRKETDDNEEEDEVAFEKEEKSCPTATEEFMVDASGDLDSQKAFDQEHPPFAQSASPMPKGLDQSSQSASNVSTLSASNMSTLGGSSKQALGTKKQLVDV